MRSPTSRATSFSSYESINSRDWREWTTKVFCHVSYSGLLVIGRDRFIQHSGLMQRFRWRSHKTIIDSKPLHCMTFDQLLEESIEKLSTLKLSDQLE